MNYACCLVDFLFQKPPHTLTSLQIPNKTRISMCPYVYRKIIQWLLCSHTCSPWINCVVAPVLWCSARCGPNFPSISDVTWYISSLPCFSRHIWIYCEHTSSHVYVCIGLPYVCVCVHVLYVNTPDSLNWWMKVGGSQIKLFVPLCWNINDGTWPRAARCTSMAICVRWVKGFERRWP